MTDAQFAALFLMLMAIANFTVAPLYDDYNDEHKRSFRILGSLSVMLAVVAAVFTL